MYMHMYNMDVVARIHVCTCVHVYTYLYSNRIEGSQWVNEPIVYLVSFRSESTEQYIPEYEHTS